MMVWWFETNRYKRRRLLILNVFSFEYGVFIILTLAANRDPGSIYPLQTLKQARAFFALLIWNNLPPFFGSQIFQPLGPPTRKKSSTWKAGTAKDSGQALRNSTVLEAQQIRTNSWGTDCFDEEKRKGAFHGYIHFEGLPIYKAIFRD